MVDVLRCREKRRQGERHDQLQAAAKADQPRRGDDQPRRGDDQPRHRREECEQSNAGGERRGDQHRATAGDPSGKDKAQQGRRQLAKIKCAERRANQLRPSGRVQVIRDPFTIDNQLAILVLSS
jgi:hypothetical protein